MSARALSCPIAASAGGHELHPSEVNSSTTKGRCCALTPAVQQTAITAASHCRAELVTKGSIGWSLRTVDRSQSADIALTVPGLPDDQSAARFTPLICRMSAVSFGSYGTPSLRK